MVFLKFLFRLLNRGVWDWALTLFFYHEIQTGDFPHNINKRDDTNQTEGRFIFINENENHEESQSSRSNYSTNLSQGKKILCHDSESFSIPFFGTVSKVY